VLNNLFPWQERLRSRDFVQPPWEDRHPARLAIEADLPSDSLRLARAIDSLVDQLSLRHLVASYRGRGSTPHRPDLLLKAVLFCVQRGEHRPAQWFKQSSENRVVQWLLRNLRPSRARWVAFRRRLVPFLDDLNRQLLHLARQDGLLDVQLPILDGTLFAANSTRHHWLNLTTLTRRLLQLQQAIEADEAAQQTATPDSGPTEGSDPASGPVAATVENSRAGVAGNLAVEPVASASVSSTELLQGPLGDSVAAVSSPAAELAVALEPAGVAEEPTDSSVATGLLPSPLSASVATASNPTAEPAPVVAGEPTAAARRPSRPLPKPVKPAGATRGSTDRPAWMARTARGRQEQQKRYQKAQERLAERLWQNAQRRKEDRKPPEQVRLSPGDPEASPGLDKQRVYRPLYNGQVACDLDTDFYLAYEVFSGVNDVATLLPMLRRLDYFLSGVVLYWLLSDSGYASGANLRDLEKEEVVLLAPWQENDRTNSRKVKKQIPKSEFVWNEAEQTCYCPQGHRLEYLRVQSKRRGERLEKHQLYRCPAEHCRNCPRQADCTSKPAGGRMVVRNEYEAEVQRHQARRHSPEVKELYRKRKEQIERRIADTRQHRQLHRLSMRGQDGAKVQLGLIVLANNLVTFDKLDRAAQDVNPSPATPS
jgi:hypothetical protein